MWRKRPPQRHDLCLNADFFIDKNLMLLDVILLVKKKNVYIEKKNTKANIIQRFFFELCRI
jgi:hypothetical protein